MRLRSLPIELFKGKKKNEKKIDFPIKQLFPRQMSYNGKKNNLSTEQSSDDINLQLNVVVFKEKSIKIQRWNNDESVNMQIEHKSLFFLRERSTTCSNDIFEMRMEIYSLISFSRFVVWTDNLPWHQTTD